MPPFRSKLEPVLESHEGEKSQSSNKVDPPQIAPYLEQGLLGLPCIDSRTKSFIQPKTIPSLDKELATQLWEEEQEKLKTKDEEEKPPLSIIAHTEVGYELQDDILSSQDDKMSDGLASEDPMLNMLPDYVNKYESGSEIVPLPTPNIPVNEPKKDVANLQALLSAPVTCTIPLADLLKIKPNLWEKVMGLPKVGEFLHKTQHQHK